MRWMLWGIAAGLVPFILFYAVPWSLKAEVPGWARLSVFPLVLVPAAFTAALGRYRLDDLDLVLRRGLTEVTAVIANRRLAPTHTQQDLENRITRPNIVTLTGGRVIAGAIVDNPVSGDATEQKRNPERLLVRNVPGNGVVRVRWIVQGAGPFTVTVDSEKGGVATGRSR